MEKDSVNASVIEDDVEKSIMSGYKEKEEEKEDEGYL